MSPAESHYNIDDNDDADDDDSNDTDDDNDDDHVSPAESHYRLCRAIYFYERSWILLLPS